MVLMVMPLDNQTVWDALTLVDHTVASQAGVRLEMSGVEAALAADRLTAQVLEVSDVFIVGHYGCGGIAAALEDADHGLIDNWLEHIKDVRRRHADELESLAGEAR